MTNFYICFYDNFKFHQRVCNVGQYWSSIGGIGPIQTEYWWRLILHFFQFSFVGGG